MVDFFTDVSLLDPFCVQKICLQYKDFKIISFTFFSLGLTFLIIFLRFQWRKTNSLMMFEGDDSLTFMKCRNSSSEISLHLPGAYICPK